MSERALAALADPTRRRILDLLSERGPQTVSALAESFETSRQAVSKHVAQLESSGLLQRATSGRAVLFSVESAALRETSAWLDRTTQRWEQRLDRLATMVESPEDARS